MDLLGQLLGGGLRATWSPTDDRWYEPYPGASTSAGIPVNEEQAQKVSAWYRGRDLLATTLAMLPLQVYERLPDDGGSEVARSNPLYYVLHDEPNPWQDSFTWRRQKGYHLIDHGNGYDRIIPGARGFVDQLHPIHPTLVTPQQLDSGRVVYHVRNPRTNQSKTHTQDEIFHLCGASDDGVVGKGVLKYARESIGTALATEGYAAGIFGKGTLNGGVIENPGTLDDDAGRRMAISFLTKPGEWHIPKVLEQGSKWIPNTMSPEDAQMLLSRKFSVDDIARWLGVPRQMLMNSDPSFGNAEQFRQDFIDFTMGPWLSMWEFAIKRQLVLNQSRFYAEFTRDALVRGDLAARSKAEVDYVNAGVRSVDEVRGQNNWNKRGGKADELREPQNITGKAQAPEPDEKPETPARKATTSGDDSASASLLKAQAITHASAERLLRKEVAAVQKAAVRHARDEDGFVQAVTEFYAKHAELVALTLQMSQADADTYCAGQADQIVNGEWLAALDLWQTAAYAGGLAAIALEEAA